MIHPATSSKVVQVEERRAEAAEPSGVPIRRYRLARLRLHSRSHDPASRLDHPASRFEHLKPVYD